ncbi:cytochrome b [Marinobacter zhejiangensis]|uniref:Cytochrome b561 n=1 Tax=Marinobacter zhejiangensis TaxID=488535 RepID=A0A1I4PWN4_9GAMM|nr:cytochrome b [Marinobacter zhejiangensis]SFM32219.1 cytochrome b561 [Marinobacter zhejiangensis]
MSLMETEHRYGVVSKTLHWLMAALLLIMLASDVWFEAFEHSISEHTLMGWHQSIGALLFGLVLFRGFWRWLNRNRLAPHAQWATLAKWGHFALYAAMVLMPLSGVITVLGEGDALTLFGLTVVPAGPEVEWMEDIGEDVHESLASVLWVMIGLHVAAALVHQYWVGDRTLKRMV